VGKKTGAVRENVVVKITHKSMMEQFLEQAWPGLGWFCRSKGVSDLVGFFGESAIKQVLLAAFLQNLPEFLKARAAEEGMDKEITPIPENFFPETMWEALEAEAKEQGIEPDLEMKEIVLDPADGFIAIYAGLNYVYDSVEGVYKMVKDEIPEASTTHGGYGVEGTPEEPGEVFTEALEEGLHTAAEA
jgi:hypothetical protein